MTRKLIAIGNVLMGDDGIALCIARILENKLLTMGIKVIYGETDASYCLTEIEEGDYLILLDAAFSGKQPGEVTRLAFSSKRDGLSSGIGSISMGLPHNKEGISLLQHDIRLPELLKLYYKNIEGFILMIEAEEISFRCGISTLLQQKAEDISKEVLMIIKDILLT